MEAAASFGARAIMTSAHCRSGTDRAYEAVRDLGADIVVNVQGDEPEIRGDMIDAIFRSIETEEVEMATLCTPIAGEEEYRDPNCVKVVLDKAGFALYFSRSPIPFLRDGGAAMPVLKHIGIYGYTMFFLEKFVSMGKSGLEEAESLEQLRALENGHRIKVLVTECDGFGIDTEEDMTRFCGETSSGASPARLSSADDINTLKELFGKWGKDGTLRYGFESSR